jgi:selenide, water dikinase
MRSASMPVAHAGRPLVANPRVLLAGGGHAHLEVLRRYSKRPERALDVTLVSPEESVIYSGMLPGLVAGHYQLQDAQIDLVDLAARANVRLVTGKVIDVDLRTRIVELAGGSTLGFDVLSLDIGTQPDSSLPGAREHAVGVKPARIFLKAWQDIERAVATGAVRTIAVIGAGAAGIEMLLAMQYRLMTTLGEQTPRFVLVSDQPALLPRHPPEARRRVGRILVSRGVVLRLATEACALESGAIVARDHSRIATECIVLAITPAPAAWLARTGLACDPAGAVRVNDALQSVSHPFVFATGDCAASAQSPQPKSGVHAVREGPPLAANLARSLTERRLRKHRPPRAPLALISTGDRHAIASWPPLVAEGRWVWRWKDSIDRRYIRRLRDGTEESNP